MKMPPLPLLAPLLLLLCFRAPRAVAVAVAADPTSTPTPTPWPHQFNAALIMGYRRTNCLVNLWYDWPGGRNLHEILYVLAPDTPYYAAEWSNGTTFFYTPAFRACRSVEAGVGVRILRPDWLATAGAAYLGRATSDWPHCHVWSKDNFTYYEDVRTGHPVKWVFRTGRTVDVLSFDPGPLPKYVDAEWQAPAYCFAKEDGGPAKNDDVPELPWGILTSNPDEIDDGSFIPMTRMLRGD